MGLPPLKPYICVCNKFQLLKFFYYVQNKFLCKVHVIILSKECQSIFLNKKVMKSPSPRKREIFWRAEPDSGLLGAWSTVRSPHPFLLLFVFLSHCVGLTIYTWTFPQFCGQSQHSLQLASLNKLVGKRILVIVKSYVYNLSDFQATSARFSDVSCDEGQ